ncbi:MAG: alpha-galactosidase [Protaetiibacter sp.]
MIREEAEAAGGVELHASWEGVRVYSGHPVTVSTSRDRVECVIPASDEPVQVIVEVPLGDAAAFWRPSTGYDLRLPPDWRGRGDTSGIFLTPFGVLHDQNGHTSAGFAIEPADSAASLRYGVSEESAAFVVQFALERSERERRVVIDLSGGELFDTVARLRNEVHTTPAHRVAALADEPVYSTWYSFHDGLDANTLLEEARLAKELGFGCLFLDYGWQRLGDSRYFDGCGDWVADETKFPDLVETVREIQALGLGVVLWVAPLLLGERSDAFTALSAAAPNHNPNLRAHILDPRRAEVREHVIRACTRLVTELRVDGLKIDFIDAATIYASPGDVAAHGEIAAATTTLLDELRLATDELGFPDLIFEYREPYIGLGLAASGDVIRAEDCPGDFLANRRSTIDLRVWETGQRVHSDMMMWDPGLPDPLVVAALSNATFSVPQISMRLAPMSPDARSCIGAWLGHWRQVRELALHGRLVDLRPQLHYPSATAIRGDSSLSVAWSSDCIVTVPPDVRRAVLVNGTTSTGVSVRLAAGGRARVVDHLGVDVGTYPLSPGLGELPVPVGGRGYLDLG